MYVCEGNSVWWESSFHLLLFHYCPLCDLRWFAKSDFFKGDVCGQVQFLCSKPASDSQPLKSKFLTLSSVERNQNNQIRTIHQMPCGRRWAAAGAQSGCWALPGPELTHWGENKKDSFVALQQYFLDTLYILWALLSDVGDNFSEAATLAFSKTSFCSG